jgi:hypothetical protein
MRQVKNIKNGVNEVNEVLVDVLNSKGFVVRQCHDWKDNTFGKTNIITIENGEFRLTFVTNVLHGHNYFQILQLDKYLQNRVYKAQRYFYKYIPLINEINGEIYTRLYN